MYEYPVRFLVIFSSDVGLSPPRFLLPQSNIALLWNLEETKLQAFSQEFFCFQWKGNWNILHWMTKILLDLFLRVWICPTILKPHEACFLYLFPLSANGGGTRRTHNESLLSLKAPPCRSLYSPTICFLSLLHCRITELETTFGRIKILFPFHCHYSFLVNLKSII